MFGEWDEDEDEVLAFDIAIAAAYELIGLKHCVCFVIDK